LINVNCAVVLLEVINQQSKRQKKHDCHVCSHQGCENHVYSTQLNMNSFAICEFNWKTLSS